MSDQPITDTDWLHQRHPHASEEQEEAFLERVSLMLERTSAPTWGQVEYARKKALEAL